MKVKGKHRHAKEREELGTHDEDGLGASGTLERLAQGKRPGRIRLEKTFTPLALGCLRCLDFPFCRQLTKLSCKESLLYSV